MTRDIDIALLRTFVTVAEHASMTAAGNALHLTQGAVSQRIRRLELLFGAALFERDRRGLRLTVEGERLSAGARRLLGINDGIWTEMTGGRIGGRIGLGVPFDLVGTFMAPVLEACAVAHPAVEVTLSCGSSPELLRSLSRGEVDMAIAEEPSDVARGELLRVEPLVWVGARAGSAHLRHPLPVSMVADSCAFRPAVLDALRVQGRGWKTLSESGSVEATAATVRADLAVTACLGLAIPPGLTVLGTDTGLPGLPPFAVSMHLPEGGGDAAVAGLARCVRESVLCQAA